MNREFFTAPDFPTLFVGTTSKRKPKTMCPAFPPDELRSRVSDIIRKHWVPLRQADRPPRVPRHQVEEVSRAVLDTMLTRQYRIGPLPGPAVYEQLLDRVRRKVRRNLPVYVAIGYGPLKNQNGVSYSRVDWAEFFALCHLAAWHNKVQAVYAPGLLIRIIFDDTTLAMANRVRWPLMKSYMSSFPSLTKALGYDRVFYPPMQQSAFSWVLHLGFYQMAYLRVRRWERDPAHAEQIERMVESARRNIALPPELSPEEQERFLRAASHRYRVYWEALQLSGLTQSTSRIIAMYLDGTQHHLRQLVALHLTSLDKGQVTQPWQGEGALLDNGHNKLEPFVLTAQRRKRHRSQVVEGLDLIPHPGFERLPVVWPCDSVPGSTLAGEPRTGQSALP